MKNALILCGIGICLLFGTAFAFGADGSDQRTEFRPGELWPDNHGTPINAHGGGILFHDGRYWWFGEHKIEGEAGNRAHVGVHCYSSENLLHWRDEGIALAVSENPDDEIARGCVIERPKVLYNAKTNKFVMWFHLEHKKDYSYARSGIAVADSVAGPYHFIRAIRSCPGVWPLNAPPAEKKTLTDEELAEVKAIGLRGGMNPRYPKDRLYRIDFEEGQQSRDMTLFQDDNGKAYHLYSSEMNGVFQIAELTDDYLDHTGDYVRLFLGRFFEAPAIMKRNGKYYLFASGCTGWKPNAARLAVADEIFGPWQELGNPCHGSEAQKANTFESQSTFILHVQGKDEWIFMADRWRSDNAIDGRYVWLPIRFDEKDVPYLEWHDAWNFGMPDEPERRQTN